MQSTKLKIGTTDVNLRKKPYEPIVLARIDGNIVEFSIANNVIDILSGEVPPEIFPSLKQLITQYFLPVTGSKIQKTKPPFVAKIKDIIVEFQKHGIEEKYIPDGVQIVQNRMKLKQCTLEEAVNFFREMDFS